MKWVTLRAIFRLRKVSARARVSRLHSPRASDATGAKPQPANNLITRHWHGALWNYQQWEK